MKFHNLHSVCGQLASKSHLCKKRKKKFREINKSFIFFIYFSGRWRWYCLCWFWRWCGQIENARVLYFMSKFSGNPQKWSPKYVTILYSWGNYFHGKKVFSLVLDNCFVNLFLSGCSCWTDFWQSWWSVRRRIEKVGRKTQKRKGRINKWLQHRIGAFLTP